VRDGTGKKDKQTMLPRFLEAPLHLQLQKTKQMHDLDLEMVHGKVELPYALDRKHPIETLSQNSLNF
jgi:hypothetical protein